MAAETGGQAIPVPEGVEVLRDVVYGNGAGRELHLDLFLPKAGGSGRPGLVFLHGGGWSGHDR